MRRYSDGSFNPSNAAFHSGQRRAIETSRTRIITAAAASRSRFPVADGGGSLGSIGSMTRPASSRASGRRTRAERALIQIPARSDPGR